MGRALALALGRRGSEVALVARTAGALEAVAAEVAGKRRGRRPRDPRWTWATRRPSTTSPRSGPIAALGGVDVLVHNAGTLGHVRCDLADAECGALERALSVNVLGARSV
ncbi:MAG: SDR family NAD(P)-dependent oxidoreductase [Deltaproteobacteria bacterium]|nr:SDR family NAD(P)-dependent oxidoreductase [Deltaproteobacteria bacterium]